MKKKVSLFDKRYIQHAPIVPAAMFSATKLLHMTEEKIQQAEKAKLQGEKAPALQGTEFIEWL